MKRVVINENDEKVIEGFLKTIETDIADEDLCLFTQQLEELCTNFIKKNNLTHIDEINIKIHSLK